MAAGLQDARLSCCLLNMCGFLEQGTEVGDPEAGSPWQCRLLACGADKLLKGDAFSFLQIASLGSFTWWTLAGCGFASGDVHSLSSGARGWMRSRGTATHSVSGMFCPESGNCVVHACAKFPDMLDSAKCNCMGLPVPQVN